MKLTSKQNYLHRSTSKLKIKLKNFSYFWRHHHWQETREIITILLGSILKRLETLLFSIELSDCGATIVAPPRNTFVGECWLITNSHG